MAEKKVQNRFPTTWISLIFIVLIVTVTYSNIYNCPFAFDGTDRIENNSEIKDLGSFFSFEHLVKPRFFVNLTFALNYRFGKLNVWPYHLVNVLIHVINGFIVYFLAMILFGRLTSHPKNTVSLLSLFAALLFVSHPVQTQAVTYTVQRYTSMAALFYMASVLFYLKARILKPKAGKQGLILFILSTLCGLTAFLCKESTASLPGAIILTEYLFFDRTWSAWKKKIPWFSVMIMLWFIFILYISGLFSGTMAGNRLFEDISDLTYETETVGRWSYLCTQFNVMIIYLRLFILPVRQNLDYLYPFKSGFFDGYTPLAFLILAGLVFLGFKRRKTDPLCTFAIGWFFITLSVESSLIPIRDAIYEHRLYLPLGGISMYLPHLMGKLATKKRRWAIVATVSIIVALAAGTHLRNRVWQDNRTLWSDVIQKNPVNYRAHYNLGYILDSRDRHGEAIDLYRKAIKLNPAYAKAYNNLGNSYSAMGNPETAVGWFKQAITVDPQYAKAYYNLGTAFSNLGKTGEAIEAFKEAITFKPGYAEALNSLGAAYSAVDNFKEAVPLFKKTIEIDPALPEAYHNLGAVYFKTGRGEEAVALFNKAIELKPDYADAYNSLGAAFSYLGDKRKAVDFLKKAVEHNPRDTKTYYNLGVTYIELAQFEEAMIPLKKALDLNPVYAEAHNRLGIVYFSLGKTDQALESFKRAVTIRPDYDEPYNSLGIIYSAINKKDEAVTAFKKAIELNPGSAKPYCNLANIHRHAGRQEEAIPLFKRATEIDSLYTKAYCGLGAVYYDTGRRDEAIGFFKQAIELKPDFSEPHAYLSAIYFWQQKYDLAISHCDRAMELGYPVNKGFLDQIKPYRN